MTILAEEQRQGRWLASSLAVLCGNEADARPVIQAPSASSSSTARERQRPLWMWGPPRHRLAQGA